MRPTCVFRYVLLEEMHKRAEFSLELPLYNKVCVSFWILLQTPKKTPVLMQQSSISTPQQINADVLTR